MENMEGIKIIIDTLIIIMIGINISLFISMIINYFNISIDNLIDYLYKFIVTNNYFDNSVEIFMDNLYDRKIKDKKGSTNIKFTYNYLVYKNKLYYLMNDIKHGNTNILTKTINNFSDKYHNYKINNIYNIYCYTSTNYFYDGTIKNTYHISFTVNITKINSKYIFIYYKP
jgi:hypothetical protein